MNSLEVYPLNYRHCDRGLPPDKEITMFGAIENTWDQTWAEDARTRRRALLRSKYPAAIERVQCG